ncbi:hypothetical protein Fot_03556 [Forsythia ovata]|uniref:Ribosomal protein S10 n=1 Tax=Forsythia ovata TaxID=205694 RepID=A0ABD1XA49_9LAMI
MRIKGIGYWTRCVVGASNSQLKAYLELLRMKPTVVRSNASKIIALLRGPRIPILSLDLDLGPKEHHKSLEERRLSCYRVRFKVHTLDAGRCRPPAELVGRERVL